MLPDLPPSRLVELYRVMLLIRRFEEGLIKLHSQGHAFGHYHLYIGQEVTGALTLPFLEAGDAIFTTHRNHGHLLARGADPGRLLAEILGKVTGYNKGKGGTLHTTPRELGVLHVSALVGGVVPVATGAGFACRRLGQSRVSVCLFGDGALEEGAFYEAINLAALWKLPVIYLCENNSLEALGQEAGEYFVSTVAAAELTDLAKAFRVPAVAVDGTDAGAVHRVFSEAVRRGRQGDGPTFIEARTARWPGSRPLWPVLSLTGETDLAVAWDEARIPDEQAEWHRHRDGLLGFTRELLRGNLITRDRVLELDREVRGEVERAAEFAVSSPYPAPGSAMDEVFVREGAR
jgi:TPP-dependent pyruvate/acetoin dehydrogenase alpha subunit